MVTNFQLYITIGLPVIAVLASMTVSLVQISGIREEIRDVGADIREIRSDVELLAGRFKEGVG